MGSNEWRDAIRKPAPGSIGGIISRLYPVVAVLFLLSYAGAMAIGIFIFFFTAEGTDFSTNLLSQLSFYIFYFSKLSLPGPFTAGSMFLLLSILFAVAFLVAALSNVRYSDSVRQTLRSQAPSGIFSNFLMAMPAISSATFVSISLIHLLEESVGLPVGEITFPNPFQEILFTTYAAFIEEVSFRLVPVAFPVAAYLLFQSSPRMSNMSYRRRLLLVPLALFKPESFRRRMGLDSDNVLARLKLTLVVISAVMFSYAHIASGTWESGKLLTTFIGGLVLGYCCLRYGWESALLVHWFFNTYWSTMSYASDLGPGFAAFYDVSFIMTLYLGLATLMGFGISIASKLIARRG